MIGLTSLKVFNSIFYITAGNCKFEVLTDNFDEFSFEELKYELEEILTISDITLSHLQHEIIGPRNFQAYKKKRSENSSTNCYIILLMGYARSPFRNCGSYLRVVVSLDEDDNQLILTQYNSKFVNYAKSLGIYTNIVTSEAVYTKSITMGPSILNMMI